MIRLPFLPARRDYMIDRLTTMDSSSVARIHAEDFARPWSDGEFAALLAQEPVFGYLAREVGHAEGAPAGFVLARMAGGEAEILTLAVARAHRRQGLGWLLMNAVLRHLHAERAEALFLEVDPHNQPAIALYRRLGFREVGKRPGYYPGASGGSAAMVMRRDL